MEPESSTSGCIEAVVRTVHKDSRYAVAYPKKDQQLADARITFSFRAWTGEVPPMNGQCVLLSQVSRFEKGWRALKAAPITVDTEASV